jgi:protein SCO1/2
VLRRVLLFGFALLTLFVVAAAVWLRIAPPRAKLPVHGVVPEFSLTERGEKSVSRADLGGQVWIADFIFTRCAGPCPLMTARMAHLQEQFREFADVKLVSFTVDPDYDTPAVLRNYAERAGATRQWLFLTGEKGTIYELARSGFRLTAADEEGEILHSTMFVLVDQRGQIRGFYDSNEEHQMQKLVVDVEILRQKRP